MCGIVAQTEVIAKGNQEREYIIGALSQSSGGPIALTYLTFYCAFTNL